jgi:hypothetical protein
MFKFSRVFPVLLVILVLMTLPALAAEEEDVIYRLAKRRRIL